MIPRFSLSIAFVFVAQRSIASNACYIKIMKPTKKQTIQVRKKTGICLTNKDIRHTIRINGPSETEKKYSMDSTTLEWEYRILIIILFLLQRNYIISSFCFIFVDSQKAVDGIIFLGGRQSTKKALSNH